MRLEEKRSIRVSRKLWLAVALVALVGVFLVAQNSPVLVDSYGVVDQRTIAVRVAVAPRSWTRVTNVEETLTEVQVSVETWPCPIPLAGTAHLATQDLTVSLANDLTSRVVQDQNGQQVPAR